MTVNVVADARRWAGFRCFGVYGLLLDVHAFYEDMVGALDADQLPLARNAVRSLVRHCLHIRALVAGGFPPDEHDALADPFDGLPDDVVADGLTVARAMARASDLDAARTAAADVGAYVRRLEIDLDFAEPATSIRQSGGLFPALRLTRRLLPLNRAAGLPVALPGEWLPADEAAPTAGDSRPDPSSEGN